MAAANNIVNHYAALEIEDENADEATIKKAYRKLVLKWHPDKHPEGRQEAEDRIRLINVAYEVLGNPTKRTTYDQQRRAVKRRAQGFGPPPAGGAPRMRIPKEFLMMPIGFPDKFVRYQGTRLAVGSRADAREVEFQTFFEDTKWSLWWLPEVNNMCRVRALGSRAFGERMGASAGMCGGLNLSFYIDPMNPTDSEVRLEDARKGEKVDKVNFIAVTSPAYEGAFRFEAAYRRGYYLIFLPPTHLRVAPYDEKDAGVADFALVDFAIMFRFIEMEEVLQPAVKAYKDNEAKGWVTLSELRKDRNIVLYFSNILQKPIWDSDDFITYFEGHWETWEYNKEKQSVRLRPPEEKLAQMLNSARDEDGIAAVIAGAREELGRLPLPAAVKALVMLAAVPKEETLETVNVTRTINRIAAQKKLLASLGAIVATALEDENAKVSLTDLLDMCDVAGSVGGVGATADLQQFRLAAQAAVAELVFKRLDGKAETLTSGILERLLRLPGAASSDALLAAASESFVADVGLELALGLVRGAGSAACAEVAGTFAASALLLLDSQQTEPTIQEQLNVLRILGSAGAAMEDVAGRLQGLVRTADVGELATVVLAMGERGFASEAFSAAVAAISAKPDFPSLAPAKLLDLAVAATKTTSLVPIVGAVARAAANVGTNWPASDLVRLLLAIAKTKGATNPEDRAQLLRRAAGVLTPELGAMVSADLVKLVLAIAGDGLSPLLEAAAEEAVASRISGFPPQQLLILTQGLVQGLGGAHTHVRKLAEFWTESIRDAGGGGDSGDEVTKRRRELEQRNRLSADHLVQLARITGAADGGRDLAEVIGGQLVFGRFKELTEAGRKAAEAQLAGDAGLGQYSRKDRLKRSLSSLGGGSRSRSRRRSESRSRRHRSRSRRKEPKKRSRSRSRGREYRR